ncbi:MAG: isoprenylcysteine carboxylmethyltransferase family protein [Oscillospiraceae bacterium]|nr:isoprenylcysteine carboxylmethyltransferase family protein [Oscillospiraceae bacterium]
MNKPKHLPRYGVGPFYVAGITALTVLGLSLEQKGMLTSGSIPQLRLPFLIAAVILMLFGTYIWCAAIFGKKIGDDIRSNTLATTGIYAHVRNPIYSGIAITLTGVLLLAHNLWLFLLPPVFWAAMTVLMICTEEKWLTKLYWDEYTAYCKKVNRCIPWFSR